MSGPHASNVLSHWTIGSPLKSHTAHPHAKLHTPHAQADLGLAFVASVLHSAGCLTSDNTGSADATRNTSSQGSAGGWAGCAGAPEAVQALHTALPELDKALRTLWGNHGTVIADQVGGLTRGCTGEGPHVHKFAWMPSMHSACFPAGLSHKRMCSVCHWLGAKAWPMTLSFCPLHRS